MKLATYKDGSRDGQLVVVSRDLSLAHYATGIAHTLQQVLDDWNFLSPQLQDLSHTLNQGKARHAFAFDPALCMAPLPRAYQWLDGSAYLNHTRVMRQSRGAVMPEGLMKEPLMHLGCSDDLSGPQDPIVAVSTAHGIDFEAELAVVTSDVPLGVSADQALDAVRLFMLVNDVSLRHLMPDELSKGFGFVQGKPASAFSPVAVTPDELGPAWQGGRVHLSLQTAWNERTVGLCDTGPEMHFHFGELIAHAARTRRLRAGTIVGSGAVSNQGNGQGSDMSWPKGYHCIAEKRAMELVQDGQVRTDFMQPGDTVHIEMKGKDGQSIFGAIHQTVRLASAA